MAIRSFRDPQTPTRNLAKIDSTTYYSNIKAGSSKNPYSLGPRQVQNKVGVVIAFEGLGS